MHTNTHCDRCGQALFDNRIDETEEQPWEGWHDGEELLSVNELAEALKLASGTIRSHLSKYRDFPGYKLGGRWRFKLSEVVSFLSDVDERRKRGRKVC